jgi:hypothetical protein
MRRLINTMEDYYVKARRLITDLAFYTTVRLCLCSCFPVLLVLILCMWISGSCTLVSEAAILTPSPVIFLFPKILEMKG